MVLLPSAEAIVYYTFSFKLSDLLVSCFCWSGVQSCKQIYCLRLRKSSFQLDAVLMFYCIVLFFWCSGIMDCMLLIFETKSFAHALGGVIGAAPVLPLMNSFNNERIPNN